MKNIINHAVGGNDNTKNTSLLLRQGSINGTATYASESCFRTAGPGTITRCFNIETAQELGLRRLYFSPRCIIEFQAVANITESLHVLFTLYSDFKANVHFQQQLSTEQQGGGGYVPGGNGGDGGDDFDSYDHEVMS